MATDNKLIRAFFYPAVALMGRLNINRKFLLLGLMSLVALTVVMYSLFYVLKDEIDFSRRELKGIELIKPFPYFVQVLQQHRGLSAGLLNGDETMRDNVVSMDNKVSEAVKAIEKKLPPGLASNEDFLRIRADWELLRKEGPTWAVDENIAAHTRLISRVQLFEGLIADDYALFLDPEFSTYYLLDSIVNKLPQALEYLGQLRAHCTGILVRKQATPQQKIEINILIAKIDDAFGMLKINLDKTARYNPVLQGVISTASKEIMASSQQITGLVTSDILTGHFATGPDHFFGMATAMIDKSYINLHETLLPTVEALIKARIEKAENTLRTSIGIALLLLLVVSYFSIGISRFIAASIQSIARSAHAFAGGDLRERIDLGAHDEFGRVGNSFNEMADGFGALLKISRENEIRLFDLSANLEERVKVRTLELDRANGQLLNEISERKHAEERIAYSESLFRGLFENMHSGVAVYAAVDDGEDFIFRDYNRAAELLDGVNREDIIHKRLTICFPGVKDFGLFAVLQRVWKTGVPEHFPVSAYRDSRLSAWRDNHVYRLPSGEVVAIYDDVTERKRAEEQLRVAAATFETHEAILITDASANIIRVNKAFTDITGYAPEEVLGKNPSVLSSGRHDKVFYAAMWQQLLEAGSWTGEVWDRRKSGQIYPKWLTITAVKNEQGNTTQYVSIFSDITERKQAENEIRNLAFYDALTNLPNRRLMLDRFRLALSGSARSNLYGAVLFLDMDKFKTLNDTLGHDYGDLMLVEVAARIQSCVREIDTVARFGGDEFVVLLEEIDAGAAQASNKVALIAEKIRAMLSLPYRLKDHEHHSSPSIGVCLYRGNEESVDTLLKHADLAMYQAKNSGRNAVRFFDPEMQQAVETHAAIYVGLRHAVPDRQLRLHYQIQVDSEHRPFGAEALVRWIHPECGMILPGKFIPIAEESTLIIELGDWVLKAACQQLALWSKLEKTRHLELAVNVSAQQFCRHDFVKNVIAIVRAHRVNPARLKLELTESVVLTGIADIVTKMHALRAEGIKLSLDDFGTGYSSLSYLKQLPLDQIKIDQSFVHDIAIDNYDAMMVKTIIDLAQNFNLNVIAEGVETGVQLDFLKRNGCMAYQGYLFGKPVPIEEFEALLGGRDM
jgi:diguanylate cyclase (GGDEF)-like protein/PAS domain S-box-containing protein